VVGDAGLHRRRLLRELREVLRGERGIDKDLLDRRGDALDVEGRLSGGTAFSKATAAQLMFVAEQTAVVAPASAAMLETTSPEAPGYPVLRVVAGVGTEQEFEASAGSSAAAPCTLNFHLAVSRFMRGDREGAWHRFLQALSTGAQ
jgi:hypothetical protein